MNDTASRPGASPITVRDSRDDDLPRIQAIYAHHVRHGTGTFELEPPTLDEMGRRRADVLGNGFAWLVAEREGEVLGYAYANWFRTAPAYRFTVEDSTKLAVLLRAGALPAEMTFLEERTIGPELGEDSIEAGRLATLVAVAAVGVLMVASYGLFGTFAILALGINMVLIFAVLSLIGGTLTLPGIAGLVLTIGMAVDANVLIYERMRDELRSGAKSATKAIEQGFERALPAIVDANVTTLITAGVLFFLGAGPVRGFAVTLAIGIITSVFTAINVTRLIVETWYNWRKPKTLVV